MAHAEFPTRIDMESHHDLALFDLKEAQLIVEKDLRYPEYARCAAQRKTLAGVEIKYISFKFDADKGKEVKKDLEELNRNKAEGQIGHGYLLVFCSAKSTSENARNRFAEVVEAEKKKLAQSLSVSGYIFIGLLTIPKTSQSGSQNVRINGL